MEIGIFGGSFDPVHRGHLAVAEAALRECGLDEVWMMMSPENPLKSGRDMAPDADRLNMLRIAVEEVAPDCRGRIQASDFECGLSRPSYTVDTLRALSRRYPDCRFRLIVGEDNLEKFHLWREPETILRDYGLIVYPRAGEGNKSATVESKEASEFVYILEGVRLYPVSSTAIRRLAAGGATADALAEQTFPGVAEYIITHNLYKEHI